MTNTRWILLTLIIVAFMYGGYEPLKASHVAAPELQEILK